MRYRPKTDSVFLVNATFNAVVEDLKELSEEDLKAAAFYIHRLKEKGWKTLRLEALDALAGSLAGPEGDAFERAISECDPADVPAR